MTLWLAYGLLAGQALYMVTKVIFTAEDISDRVAAAISAAVHAAGAYGVWCVLP